MAARSEPVLRRVGLIVPVLASEAALLCDCLANIARIRAALTGEADLVVVVVPQPSGGAVLAPVVEPGVEWLPQAQAGVSRARNSALDHLRGRVDAVMFVDVAVRPSAAFLRAALVLLDDAPLVSAPVVFAAESPEGGAAPSRVSAAFLVYRGFIWSSLIRLDAIGDLRFLADIGPGTPSHHQAGEDSRLLYAIVRGQGLRSLPFLSGLPVARLPRDDLAEKVARYSFGQGYLVGQYLMHPVGGLAGFGYFLLRALLFVLKSLVMLAGTRSRGTGFRRLRAFSCGLFGRDRSVPSLGRGV
ncbi:hypothetical protein GE253_04215 [Niveispirillum sp. SYP-B3756]|uniref:hypothetical protein n=1 Tax=Niveispirillum sp. SYP-B3756 TaxID=2662178 RepID=UPI001292A85A|nr:hypothetical protein [Niveispirillum sp. SYP-B3756]MQP64545.1 hypothetical protein [Niveispirillum sp. SYP-B3756]